MDAGEVKRLWIATALIAITRWLALSRTLWDWDEALFVLAVRDFDVRFHHPQPPGFPLFIALAKLLPFHDEFHALQAIAFVASLFVFPAAYFLARELGATDFVAFGSALLLVFMPNVWFYGGTAFSDVPSLTLVLVACALLLRRTPRSILIGAIILGIAAGFRPQNLIIGFVPFLLTRKRIALAGALLTLLIVVLSYGGAVAASGGWSDYRAAVAEHEHYIRTTDSFLSPIRPSLIQVADDFFLRPFRAPVINMTLIGLVGIGLVGRRRWLAVAIFAPFLIFAWLYLDFHSTSRFSIGYMPMFAILAADGIDALRKARGVVLAAVAALMIVWTFPALWLVHRTVSPPVAALQSVKGLVYVDERLAAHAAVLLRDYRVGNAGTPFVYEGGEGFTRDRARLAGIARDRYFEVSVKP
ncbi:MAG TPA: hypothetical protein VKB93_25050 [Thermoanaerobaculia bacterium]|nr:hypothetical protein [Thermoanaerobaculia bacterium]